MIKPLPIFVEFIMNEILPKIGDYFLRPMMGAYILQSEGVTFSLINEAKWFLRTIPETESWYIEHNCEKFSYVDKKGKTIYMPYHCIPEYIFEDYETLKKLINESIIVAQIVKQSKK